MSETLITQSEAPKPVEAYEQPVEPEATAAAVDVAVEEQPAEEQLVIEGVDEPVSIADQKQAERQKRKPRGMTEHGFRVGSDSAIIVDILIAGGLDRQDINEKVAEAINTSTRNGRPKNIPSLISGLLARLEERGYYIESSWRVVPPQQ